MPHAMPADARYDVERHFREPLFTEGEDVPWLTIAGALSSVTALQAVVEGAALLNEIEQFIVLLHRQRTAWHLYG